MRKKRSYRVLTFSTTTDAMAAEKRCREAAMPGRLIPVPREITAGCGLAWRMTVEEYEEYLPELRKLELRIEKSVALEM